MKRAFLAISVLLMIASCATVPVPKNKGEAMAVLITEYIQDTKIAPFGNYKIMITNSEGTYKKYFVLTKTRNYYLTDLTPGQYEVSYLFEYTKGNSMGSSGKMFNFVVHKGKSQVVSKKIVIQLYEKTHGKLYMSRGVKTIPSNELGKIQNNLILEHPELSAWDWE